MNIIEKQITNFVLNICNWQIENRGYYHRMSMHIQDIIPGFVIEWLVCYDGKLSFEGVYIDEENHYIKNGIKYPDEITNEQLDKILNILKNIDLFKS